MPTSKERWWGSYPANFISLAPDEGAHGSDRVGIAGVVESDDPIDRIEVADLQTDHVLGALTGGGAAPVVTVLEPTAGQVLR